jgi:two-component sensor histidine kinase
MSLANLITKFVRRSRALPISIRYGATVAIVVAALSLRLLVDDILPPGYPFAFFYLAILFCSTLFNQGSGLVATATSALLATYFFLPPADQFVMSDLGHLAALLLFMLTGTIIALTLEALHTAVADLQTANDELAAARDDTSAALNQVARSERLRSLLLREFRHRTRNDLGSLVGLLLLRARTAPSEAAREALKEAAQHALALSRVHSRLTPEDELPGDAEVGVVDTRDFVLGLCIDLDSAQVGEGLRPIALMAEAESHTLDAERAVPLGLVLNETVTNAMKYAFPEERAGAVRVRFLREGEHFLLTVVDDGIGVPPEAELDTAPPGQPSPGSGLGTRLLRALAAQLRGTFTRQPGPDGAGTLSELRFPAVPPGAAE